MTMTGSSKSTEFTERVCQAATYLALWLWSRPWVGRLKSK